MKRIFRRTLPLGVPLALLFLTVCLPVYAQDPFAFLPAKEAQAARNALASLDKSLAVWSSVWDGFVAETWKSRGAVKNAGDSAAYKKLLESGVAGTWKNAKGQTLLAAETAVRQSAERLAAIIEPRVARLDKAPVDGLIALYLEREKKLPGALSEQMRFVERLAKVDMAARAFALRALLPVIPVEVASRLYPEGKDLSSLSYGADAELLAWGKELAGLRKAIRAARAAAPALAVPELPWSREESQGAQEAAMLLSRIGPKLRRSILESGAAFPGVEELPAFLSALSPESRYRWELDRALSPSTTRVFLASSGGPEASKADCAATSLSLGRTVSELERDRARGLSGLGFLARLSDPALRYALRKAASMTGLKAEYDSALVYLASSMETRLKESDPLSISGENAGQGGGYKAELRPMDDVAGFVALRAYHESADGTRSYVPEKILDRIVERELPDLPSPAADVSKALRLGLLASQEGLGERDRTLPPCRAAGTDAETFAALVTVHSGFLRSAARETGVSYALICSEELLSLAALCESRCRGCARDEDIAVEIRRMGGASHVDELLGMAYDRLDHTVKALAVFAGEGASR